MKDVKWIPDVKKDETNWSTLPKGKKLPDNTPYGLFLDPKVVCSDPKAKVC